MIVNIYLLSFISFFPFLQKEQDITGFYKLHEQEDAHTLASFSIWLNEDNSYTCESIDDKCPAVYVNRGVWKYDKGVLTLESKKTAFFEYTMSDKGQINIGKEEIEEAPCHSSNRFTILSLYYFNGDFCKHANGKSACFRKIKP